MARPSVTHKRGKRGGRDFSPAGSAGSKDPASICIDTAAGRFELEGDGKRLGYLSYSLTDSDTLCIEYVEVSQELRGKQLGNRLVEAAVDWARQNGRRIVARC